MCLILAIAPLTFSILAEVQNRIQERKELIREQKELDMEARLQLRERKLEERLFIRGERLHFDVPAQLESNRTFVPIRFISEILGEKVVYDDETGDIDVGLEE